MSKVIYFDLENGISGDMLLGSLLDLGASEDVLEKVIQDLELDIELEIKDKEQGFTEGKDVNIITKEEHKHRKIREVIRMIKDSSLEKEIKVKSINTFTELGKVEGEIHDQPAKDVELHETGMLDSIIDIVGSIALFEDLNIDEAYYSTVRFGSGTVECEHGELSVPVPATRKLLEGWRVKMTEKEGELVTPTGAVLLKRLAEQCEPPDMTLNSIGIGFGDREKEYPNVLRIYSGTKTNQEEVMKIEFYIDDITPEILSYALERLRSHSLDVYQDPMIGKKSRSGWMITVLCEKDKISDIKDIIFSETSTLGIRITEERRICKEREFKKVETEYGEVKVKVSGDTASPEFEECKMIALEKGIPLKDVFEAAKEAFRKSS